MRTTDLDKTLGENLRVFRTTQGISQAVLASLLPQKISCQQVQKYERGTNRISAVTLYHLSNVLGKNLSDFYGNFPKIEEPDKMPLWVACERCNHEWISLYLPATVDEMNNIPRKCIKCKLGKTLIGRAV